MTARLATAEEISANGAVVAVLLGGIFSLQEERRTAQKSFHGEQHAFTSLPTGFDVKVKNGAAQCAAHQ